MAKVSRLRKVLLVGSVRCAHSGTHFDDRRTFLTDLSGEEEDPSVRIELKGHSTADEPPISSTNDVHHGRHIIQVIGIKRISSAASQQLPSNRAET